LRYISQSPKCAAAIGRVILGQGWRNGASQPKDNRRSVAVAIERIMLSTADAMTPARRKTVAPGGYAPYNKGRGHYVLTRRKTRECIPRLC